MFDILTPNIKIQIQLKILKLYSENVLITIYFFFLIKELRYGTKIIASIRTPWYTLYLSWGKITLSDYIYPQ